MHPPRRRIAGALLGPIGAGIIALGGAALAQANGNPYVALGDSYTVGWQGGGVPTPGYVGPLFEDYRASLGAGQIFNTAVPGASSSSLRNDGQLTTALADINASSDTRAVTLQIGGADALFGPCDTHWDEPGTCAFRANYEYILGQIQAALAADPGSESLVVGSASNPSAGTGTPTEADLERKLLGENLEVGCSDAAGDVGLNDAIYQEAGALGVPVANPYPAFKAHGQSYMAQDDPQHLHPNADGYAAIAKAYLKPITPCGSTPDLNPPDTTIVSGPGAHTHDRTPAFKLKSSENGSKFKCSLDGAPFKSCKATHTTPRLGFGGHTLKVQASDQAGNVDPASAKALFKVLR
jgi:lysophospholipase L1-like esterase